MESIWKWRRMRKSWRKRSTNAITWEAIGWKYLILIETRRRFCIRCLVTTVQGRFSLGKRLEMRWLIEMFSISFNTLKCFLLSNSNLEQTSPYPVNRKQHSPACGTDLDPRLFFGDPGHLYLQQSGWHGRLFPNDSSADQEQRRWKLCQFALGGADFQEESLQGQQVVYSSVARARCREVSQVSHFMTW